MVKIQPLENRVLVKPIPAEERTVSGIIIPNTSKEKPMFGEVVEVGKGVKGEEIYIKVGDKVLYNSYDENITSFDLNEEKYLIMKQTDVLAIVTEED